MTTQDLIKVADECRRVLDNNWRDTHTIPAEGLYPHQWLWDSCFIAIGTRHIDNKKAQQELRSLVKGQWANGMLPHMIFAGSGSGSRDRRIWQAWRNPHAPESLDTSGITQPPMLAEAVVRVGEMMSSVERREWYQEMLKPLVKYHRWLYSERDPHNEGLVLLLHPWESGFDNSPPWIEQVHRHHKPWWVVVIEKLRLEKLMMLVRRDTHHAPPGQRMRNIDALLYFATMQRLKRKDWDIDRILDRPYFTIEDVAFNSILVRANTLLKKIAKETAHELPKELLEHMATSQKALEELWDTGHKKYYSRDFIRRKLIKNDSIASLMPLYAGTISRDRAEQLIDDLKNSRTYGQKYPIPSVPVSSSWFKPVGYWQGPTWINTNWMIADGLQRYGFHKEAGDIAVSSVQLASMHGPYEYFSAIDGSPAGAKNFSWSAALVLDFLTQHKAN